MIDTYIQAFFPAPAVVLKRPLRAFSLGHSFVLDSLANPFEVGGPHTARDLAQFVWVCERTFAECINALSRGDVGAEEIERWGAECSAVDFAEESSKAIDYQRGAIAIPRRWTEDGQGKTTGPKVPWQLAVFQAIRGESAITPDVENAIWDMPIGRATSYAAATAWASGDQSFVSEEEEKAMAILKEAEESNG